MRLVIYLVLVFEFVFAYAKEGTALKAIPLLSSKKLDKDERAAKAIPISEFGGMIEKETKKIKKDFNTSKTSSPLTTVSTKSIDKKEKRSSSPSDLEVGIVTKNVERKDLETSPKSEKESSKLKSSETSKSIEFKKYGIGKDLPSANETTSDKESSKHKSSETSKLAVVNNSDVALGTDLLSVNQTKSDKEISRRKSSDTSKLSEVQKIDYSLGKDLPSVNQTNVDVNLSSLNESHSDVSNKKVNSSSKDSILDSMIKIYKKPKEYKTVASEAASTSKTFGGTGQYMTKEIISSKKKSKPTDSEKENFTESLSIVEKATDVNAKKEDSLNSTGVSKIKSEEESISSEKIEQKGTKMKKIKLVSSSKTDQSEMPVSQDNVSTESKDNEMEFKAEVKEVKDHDKSKKIKLISSSKPGQVETRESQVNATKRSKEDEIQLKTDVKESVSIESKSSSEKAPIHPQLSDDTAVKRSNSEIEEKTELDSNTVEGVKETKVSVDSEAHNVINDSIEESAHEESVSSSNAISSNIQNVSAITSTSTTFGNDQVKLNNGTTDDEESSFSNGSNNEIENGVENPPDQNKSSMNNDDSLSQVNQDTVSNDANTGEGILAKDGNEDLESDQLDENGEDENQDSSQMGDSDGAKVDMSISQGTKDDMQTSEINQVEDAKDTEDSSDDDVDESDDKETEDGLSENNDITKTTEDVNTESSLDSNSPYATIKKRVQGAGGMERNSQGLAMNSYQELFEKRKKLIGERGKRLGFLRPIIFKEKKMVGPGGKFTLSEQGRSGDTKVMLSNLPGTDEFKKRRSEILKRVEKAMKKKFFRSGPRFGTNDVVIKRSKLPFEKGLRSPGLIRKAFERVPVVKRVFKLSAEEELILDVSLSFVAGLRNGVFISTNGEIMTSLSDSRKKALKEWLTLLSVSLPPEWALHKLIDALLRDFDIITKSQDALIAVLDKYPLSRKLWSPSCVTGGSGGYSCGMWKLLHIVTVGVAEHRGGLNLIKSQMIDASFPTFSPADAAEVIRGFVVNFFGCQQCSENFIEKYDDCSFRRCDRLSDNAAVASSDDWKQLALWMWEVHNDVNILVARRRIDLLRSKVNNHYDEDVAAEHVKELHKREDEIRSIWPTIEMCYLCLHENGKWNEYSVFEFLERTYWDSPDSKFDRLLTFKDDNGEILSGGGVVWFMFFSALILVVILRNHIMSQSFEKQFQKIRMTASVSRVKNKIEDAVVGKHRTA